MSFLQGCLGPNDLVTPAGDGFLIIYAKSPGRDFVAETATIQDLLNAFYLGGEATKSVSVEVEHARIDTRGQVYLIGNADGTAPAPATDAGRHKFACVPVWGAKQEALAVCWIAPSYQEAEFCGYGYDSSWVQTGVNSGDDYVWLDLAIIGRAVQEAERNLASGRRCLLNYSVHATTLQRRDRREAYLEHLNSTPEGLRPFLVGRIAEIEPGTPIETIRGWVQLLQRVSKRVTIQLHESDRALTTLDSTGATSVSFTLSARQHGAAGLESYERLIPRWSSALQGQKLQFRLDNVIDAKLIAYAVSSGVDFLTSERVWPAASGPKGVSIYSRAHLSEALLRCA
jgi:hypothetical protein